MTKARSSTLGKQTILSPVWSSDKLNSKWQKTTETFIRLGQRGLLTPSFLSSLMMHIVLPAKDLVKKGYVVETTPDGNVTDETLKNWIARFRDLEAIVKEEMRAKKEANPKVLFSETYVEKRVEAKIQDWKNWLNSVCRTHSLKVFKVHGIETISITPRDTFRPDIEVFFCGSGQDALWKSGISRSLEEVHQNKQCIYWNYPGIGCSEGDVASEDDLFDAGLQQVKRLLDSGIPASKITLHGLSLGGSVAVDVALKLHQQGYPVNLEVEQSFSDIALVMPAEIKEALKEHKAYLPFVSTTASTIMLGLSLGTTVSGLISTAGLAVASASTVIGYCIATMIHTLGLILSFAISGLGQVVAFFFPEKTQEKIILLFDQCASVISYIFNCSAHEVADMLTALGEVIHLGIDLIGSIVGGTVAIGGVLSGLFMGLAIGSLLSIQNLWTNEPLCMPMVPAFNLALASICCNINSAKKVKQLLDYTEKHATSVTISHSTQDIVIPVEAALNTGLGMHPGKKNPHHGKIKSIWYSEGEHGEDLSSPIPEEDIKSTTRPERPSGNGV